MVPRSLTSGLIAISLLLAMASAPVRGDILRYGETGEIVAPSSREGESLRIETPMGPREFPALHFREVVKTPDAAAEWSDLRTRALKGDAHLRQTAALWALELGLVSECEAMLREVAVLDPNLQPSARMRAVAEKLSAPLPGTELGPLTHGLPHDLRIADGPHVMLLHQHDEDEARERVALLESVVHAYHLWCASLGFDLPPPPTKLVSVWFAKKADYVAFLRAEGATAFLNTRGYHHPTRGIVVTYDCRDDPARIRGRESILQADQELSAFDARIPLIPESGRARVTLRGKPRLLNRESARRLSAQLRSEVRLLEIEHELGRRQIDWGVAAHETIHQLVVCSRLAPRHDAFPLALHEGIAMQFEAIAGGRWAGFAPSPFYRLRDYRKLKQPPQLLATVGDVGFRVGYDEDAYARAWAAVRYLRSQRSNAFVALIDGLRAPADSAKSAALRAPQILGSALEGNDDDRWHKFMNQLRLETEPTEPSQHPH